MRVLPDGYFVAPESALLLLQGCRYHYTTLDDGRLFVKVEHFWDENCRDAFAKAGGVEELDDILEPVSSPEQDTRKSRLPAGLKAALGARSSTRDIIKEVIARHGMPILKP